MSPKYLSDIIPSITRYVTRNANNIPLVRVNNNYFMNTFFPSSKLSEINLACVLKLFKLSFMVIQLILSMIINLFSMRV